MNLSDVLFVVQCFELPLVLGENSLRRSSPLLLARLATRRHRNLERIWRRAICQMGARFVAARRSSFARAPPAARPPDNAQNFRHLTRAREVNFCSGGGGVRVRSAVELRTRHLMHALCRRARA